MDHSHDHPHRLQTVCSHAHDHARRAPQALAEVERLCAQRGVRLTPIRRAVLEALYATHQAVGAYDLIEMVGARGKRRLAPITVYRALDFLLAEGFAHKLASRNAFIACPHFHAPGEMVVFLICDQCGGVDEIASPDLAKSLNSLIGHEGFAAETRVLELSGRCAHCRAPSLSAPTAVAMA
ncbi:Fur family transcriptional regulator [Terrarubrum flagellatum]|uniref:Fur family transcriptional regulator n=1 Tax=Terrirubrum flagellatum TaxID=2895980 RepID=UPI003145034C